MAGNVAPEIEFPRLSEFKEIVYIPTNENLKESTLQYLEMVGVKNPATVFKQGFYEENGTVVFRIAAEDMLRELFNTPIKEEQQVRALMGFDTFLNDAYDFPSLSSLSLSLNLSGIKDNRKWFADPRKVIPDDLRRKVSLEFERHNQKIEVNALPRIDYPKNLRISWLIFMDKEIEDYRKAGKATVMYEKRFGNIFRAFATNYLVEELDMLVEGREKTRRTEIHPRKCRMETGEFTYSSMDLVNTGDSAARDFLKPVVDILPRNPLTEVTKELKA